MPRLVLAAGLLGFLVVALGAFGAHGLEGRLSEEALGWWETATFYGLGHAVAALAIALSGREKLGAAGWAFALGVLLFAGSLYALALGAPRVLGIVTPFGGVSFLVGWGLILWNGVRRSSAARAQEQARNPEA